MYFMFFSILYDISIRMDFIFIQIIFDPLDLPSLISHRNTKALMKTNKRIILGCLTLLGMTACHSSYSPPQAPIQEVKFTKVHLNDQFWTPRIETNRTVSIPSAFHECEKNGRFDNFALAGGLIKGEHQGDFSFDDTDPYKIIEGASYSLADRKSVV